ncbi:DnaD domain protein [Streptococcus parasanguinis]|uniref:DnaD domain protein n=1 Tax=Streptococcus parasanguinis TaxID=1318 RepID=UPI00321A2997
MAQRRMFSRKITDTDKFIEMPATTQNLYFHLNMNADDEGFVDRVSIIQRMIGASGDDLKLLIAKGFVIPFESGVVVIRHWRIHNYIQADRFQPTIHQNEKSQIEYDETKTANIKRLGECIQNVYKADTQVRLGKDRLELELDKDRLDHHLDQNDDDKNLVFKKLKEAFGEMSVNGTMVEEVERLLKQYGQELVVLALDKTILNAGKSLRYTMSILQRWDGQGLRTAEQIRVADEEYERKKSNKTQGDPYGNIPSWSNLRPENQKEPEPEMSGEEYERRLKEFLASE